MKKKIKLGEPINISFSKRFYDFTRQFAVKDIFDALVELITNSDDSYGRLYKHKRRSKNGGRILIEVNHKRGNKPSQIIIRDRAEGMTLEIMKNKLANVGIRRSEEGDRGFMARGARGCTTLGDLIFFSIVDERLYQCKLTSKRLQFIPLENGKLVDYDLRKELHINRGNGTTVILNIEPQHKVPLIDTISRDLSWHYALRDILSEKSDTEVFIKKYSSRGKQNKIVYRQPEGKLVWSEKYSVPSYPEAKVKLQIWKSAIGLEDPSDKRFRKSGFLIKSERAIHECSLLHPGFEKDDYAHYYFGRIDCPFIDVLLEEYDKRREKGSDHPADNPFLVIDPNRQYGLNRKHPFTEALLKIPTKRLLDLIEKDREEEKSKEKQIANTKTRKKLSELAKAASRFLKQQIEELELSADESIDNEIFTKRGILIYPTYANVAVNEVRTFSFYANRKMHDEEGSKVKLASDSEAIEFIDQIFTLQEHKKRPDLLYGKFRVKGTYVQEGIRIQASCSGLPKAEAVFNVVDRATEERNFRAPLEFEHRQYQIKVGSRKIIKLYAKYPEVVNKETEIKVVSSNALDLPIRGRCILVPVRESNFAYADIVIESRRIVSKPVILTADVNSIKATTKVKIVQRDEIGPDIKIEIVDEDFGYFRARWADREGRPNLLEIAAKHPSVAYYCNRQDSVEFKIVLAEIVAESVCRKLLRIETQQTSWLFNWADQKEDAIIAESVLYEFNKRMKSFLPIAHSIVLKD